MISLSLPYYLICFFVPYSRALQIRVEAVAVSLPYMLALIGLALRFLQRRIFGVPAEYRIRNVFLIVVIFIGIYTTFGLAAIVRTQLSSKAYSDEAVFRIVEQVGRLILSGCIMLYSMICARRRSMCVSGLIVLAVSAGLVALYGIYQVLGTYCGFYRPLLPNTASYGVAEGVEGATRAVGTMHEPSFLAAFLCFSLVMTFMLLAGERPRQKVIAMALFVSAVLQGLCLVMTTSTSGFVGYVTAFIAALFLLRGPVRRRFLIYWMIVAFLIVGPVVYVATQSRLARDLMVATVEKPGHISAIERTAFVKAALDMFADHPIVGVGPGLYNEYVRQYTQAFSIRRILIANNVYAELLGETGIIGFASFVILLVLVFRSAVWKWRESGHADVIAAGLLISLVSLCVQFMAYPTFKMEFIWLLFGFAVASWKPITTTGGSGLR